MIPISQGARSILADCLPRQVPTQSERSFACLLALISAELEVPLARICASSRGNRRIIWARQIAAYLTHTLLGYSLSATGKLFKLDRATIRHACTLVELSRDCPQFDQWLMAFEDLLKPEISL